MMLKKHHKILIAGLILSILAMLVFIMLTS